MSRLDDLITELCPDGVEYKKIASFSKVLRGKRLTKDKLSDANGFPVYHGGIEPLGFYSHANRPSNMVMIINVGASAGTVAYSDVEFWSSDGTFCIEKNKEVDDRYLYHFMKNNELFFMSKVRKAGIPTLDNFIIEEFSIPLPPLSVQAEIVRILDAFTELTAELTAELSARRKQYEYYRDQLLTFGDEVERASISEITNKFTDGMHNLPKTTTEISAYPILSAQNINNGVIDLDASKYVSEEVFLKENKRTDVKKGDVLLTIVGAIGRVAVVENDLQALFQRSVCVLKPDSRKIISQYLRYALESKDVQAHIQTNAHGAAQKGIYLKDVGKVTIPIPPLAEQKRIVDILDRFDALCNDITVGLPAEIEARRKQYDHYRDKLLAFDQRS